MDNFEVSENSILSAKILSILEYFSNPTKFIDFDDVKYSFLRQTGGAYIYGIRLAFTDLSEKDIENIVDNLKQKDYIQDIDIKTQLSFLGLKNSYITDKGKAYLENYTK